MLYCCVVLGYTLASCAWKTKTDTICRDKSQHPSASKSFCLLTAPCRDASNNDRTWSRRRGEDSFNQV